MYIESVFYKHGNMHTPTTCEIPELDRSKYMTNEFIRLYGKELFDVQNNGSTALIYSVGPATHGSDSKNSDYATQVGNIVVKGQLGTKLHVLGRKFKNIDYATINGDTCASSMSAMHQAKELLKEYTDVIIYAENVANDLELLFFKQLGIKLICGDGIAVMHITRDKTVSSRAKVVDTAWCWNAEKSPMTVSREGYEKVLSKLDTDGVTFIKPHGTGTEGNNSAEQELLNSRFNVPYGMYKKEVGHTQGVSTILEIGMMLDRETEFDALVLASGLGGFYGGCRLVSCK